MINVNNSEISNEDMILIRLNALLLNSKFSSVDDNDWKIKMNKNIKTSDLIHLK